MYCKKEGGMRQGFQTYVFHSNTTLTQECINGGVDGVIVDWEVAEKRNRQSLYNTQINRHDQSTLKEVKSFYDGPILCRVNGGGHISENEISEAIALGATEIIIPMIESVEQIEYALSIIDGRAQCMAMIETNKAVSLTKQIGELPIDKIYVGLNDLAIDRSSQNIFLPLIDGTLDHIREHIHVPLGVAGLTHPDLGSPIPCKLLLNELSRLKCDFSFLRRSFFKDVQKYAAHEIIQRIKTDIKKAQDYDIYLSEEFDSKLKNLKTALI